MARSGGRSDIKSSESHTSSIKITSGVVFYALVLLFSASWIVRTSWNTASATSSVGQQAYTHGPPSTRMALRSLGRGHPTRHPDRDAIVRAPHLSPTDISMAPGVWEGSPVVSEELRLVYCQIPKNACSSMKRFLMRVRRHHDWEARDNRVHDPMENGLTYMRDLSLERADQIMHDPSWTRVVIVRDPIHRFAAAFLEKCMKPHYEPNGTRIVNSNCPVSEIERSESVDQVLTVLEEQAVLGGIASLNTHFRPQSYFCDLRDKYAPSYVMIQIGALLPKLQVLITHSPNVPRDTKAASVQALKEAVASIPALMHTTPSLALVKSWIQEANELCNVAQNTQKEPGAGNEAAPASPASPCKQSIAMRLRRLCADDYGVVWPSSP